MLNLLFISDDGSGVEVALKCAKEGNKVGFYIPKPTDNLSWLLKGFKNPRLISKLTNSILDTVDIAIFTTVHNGELADWFKERNILVFGGGSTHDKLELDRAFGSKFTKFTKIAPPNTVEFKTINEGLDYIENKKEGSAIKANGNVSTTLSLVSNDFDYIKSVMTTNKAVYEKEGFIIQDKVKGIELSTESFFNGEHFVNGMFNHTIEKKRIGHGDIGVNGGCSGNIVWPANKNEKLVQAIFGNLEEPLAKLEYCGMIDMNCIVNEDKAYFLEWTCFSDDTEILTGDGWKLFKELIGTEQACTLNPNTNVIEYQDITGLILKEYKGDMIHICNDDAKHSHSDILVTPDHEIFFKKRDETEFKFVQAKDINKHGGVIKNSGNWEGEDKEYYIIPEYIESHYLGKYQKYMQIIHPEIKIKMNDWLRFLGFYIADGSLGKKHYQVNIAQKDRRWDFILDCLPFKYNYRAHGYCISSVQLAKHIKSLVPGRQDVRLIPKQFKSLNQNNLLHLMSGLIIGDGSVHKKSGTVSYSTISKQLADDIQEISMKLGWSAIVKLLPKKGTSLTIKGKTYIRNFDQYLVNIRKRQLDISIMSADKFLLHKHEYDGTVYCVEVPNHIIYVRRNGIPCFVGQCRFGYDAFQALAGMFTTTITEMFWHVVIKKPEPLALKKGYNMAVRLTLPPYPLFVPDHAKKLRGLKVLNINAGADKHTWLSDIMLNDEDKPVLAGIDGNIGCVVAGGDNIAMAEERVYRTINNIVVTPDIYYRHDIADNVEEQIKTLKKWGWLNEK